ncbi:MAG: TraB/GumN family protein [Bacteroidia bacterium]|nr:TraB/GumN family protein [Bacteroidia bacterium]
MKQGLMIFLLFSSVSVLKSQDKPTGSLLWEISGKGIEKPSFLFGTIHIQDKRVFEYSKSVEHRLLECDVYAMEMLTDGIDPEEIKNAMLMKDSTIDQLLSKDDYEKLDNYFKEQIGMSIMMFNKTKPFFISAEMLDPLIKKEMDEPLDIHLMNLAKENNKKVIGIETFDEQVETVDKIPLKEQAEMLVKSIGDTANPEAKYEEMVVTYLNADLDKMIELTNDTSLPMNFARIFVDDRNKHMAIRIAKFAKKKPTFFAIGAAHLAGKNGVISLLRKKGYTVTPIGLNGE